MEQGALLYSVPLINDKQWDNTGVNKREKFPDSSIFTVTLTFWH